MHPFTIILLICAGLVILGIWVNFRLKRVEKEMGQLGRSYYKKEEVLLNDFKSGRIRRSEYRREHERLVREMREDSRKITDN